MKKEFESSRSNRRPGDTGGLNGGHYNIDPDDGSYDHEEYRIIFPNIPIPHHCQMMAPIIYIQVREYQDQGALPEMPGHYHITFITFF